MGCDFSLSQPAILVRRGIRQQNLPIFDAQAMGAEVELRVTVGTSLTKLSYELDQARLIWRLHGVRHNQVPQ